MKKLLVLVTALIIGFGAHAQIESPVKWAYAAKRISPGKIGICISDHVIGNRIFEIHQHVRHRDIAGRSSACTTAIIPGSRVRNIGATSMECRCRRPVVYCDDLNMQRPAAI